MLLAFAIPSCKIVSNAERQAKLAADESEADIVGATVERAWEAEALPHIKAKAVPFNDLKVAIAADLMTAGAAHGYRQESEGSPWNFATQISGLIIAANTKSRAATADVDVDGDGAMDAVLQLGPVIRGTTLRDVLPFINFTQFRDQIEFAKLARAFNTRAYEAVLEPLPRSALIGSRVTATGVFTMRSAGDKVLVTPIAIALGPDT
ncbi:MAG: DUF2291 domain-containing protein [Rhodobacteraceae bacterium]|nr:DUF2291 domain-containing protein [Paracoccaceae bacterium]